jgi:hypothetical protein
MFSLLIYFYDGDRTPTAKPLFPRALSLLPLPRPLLRAFVPWRLILGGRLGALAALSQRAVVRRSGVTTMQTTITSSRAFSLPAYAFRGERVSASAIALM